MRRTFASPRTNAGKPVIGLVLGSGAARGWAHIGVLRELLAMGIRPQVVTGASVGAIVAAAYAAGHLDEFEAWISDLRTIDIIRLLDARMAGGGFLQGKRLMDAIEKRIGNPEISGLEVDFGCVATELGTGREIWLMEGSLLDACRASIALPGLFAPYSQADGSLLVDGGLVNPVPVSLARAMGAEVVIAVNLNGDLIGPHFFTRAMGDNAAAADEPEGSEAAPGGPASILDRWSARLKTGLGVHLDAYMSALRSRESPEPGLFDVIVGSIDIMQDRITRSRMAGEPPDIHITPRLSHIGLMDFDQACVSIDEGRKAAQRQSRELEPLARLLTDAGGDAAD